MKKFVSFRGIGKAEPSQWDDFKGLGFVKIAKIKAAVEIARRYNEGKLKVDNNVIKSHKDAVEILMPRMRDLPKEVFKIILLDSSNRILDIIETEQGTVN